MNTYKNQQEIDVVVHKKTRRLMELQIKKRSDPAKTLLILCDEEQYFDRIADNHPFLEKYGSNGGCQEETYLREF